FGVVAPGNEATAILEDIRAELLGLSQTGTGTPVVEAVITAREAFGADCHPDVPDLMVVFRDDLRILEESVAARLGPIPAAVYRAEMPRSGDHTIQSRLWAAGPGISGGVSGTGNVLDLAPTALSLLRVNRPATLDGRPLLAS